MTITRLDPDQHQIVSGHDGAGQQVYLCDTTHEANRVWQRLLKRKCRAMRRGSVGRIMEERT